MKGCEEQIHIHRDTGNLCLPHDIITDYFTQQIDKRDEEIKIEKQRRRAGICAEFQAGVKASLLASL